MRRVGRFTEGSLRSGETACACRGPQLPHGGSQSFLTLVPGGLTPSSSLLRYCTHAHTVKTLMYNFLRLKRIWVLILG